MRERFLRDFEELMRKARVRIVPQSLLSPNFFDCNVAVEIRLKGDRFAFLESIRPLRASKLMNWEVTVEELIS